MPTAVVNELWAPRCAVCGCDIEVPAGNRFCARHWTDMPLAVKDQLVRAYERGEREFEIAVADVAIAAGVSYGRRRLRATVPRS